MIAVLIDGTGKEVLLSFPLRRAHNPGAWVSRKKQILLGSVGEVLGEPNCFTGSDAQLLVGSQKDGCINDSLICISGLGADSINTTM